VETKLVTKNEVRCDLCTRLEIEVSSLRERMTFQNTIYGKLDDTLDKIQENAETRRDFMDKEIKDVYHKMESLEIRIMARMDSLQSEMRRMHEESQKKVDEIDKWRWIVIGGAAVVGWVMSRFLGDFGGFK
jgi:hypothetical protein